MKYIRILFFLWLIFTTRVFAQSEAYLVKISDLSPKEVSRLVRQNVDVFKIEKNRDAIAYVTAGDIEKLKASGYEIVVLPDASKIYADSLWLATKNSANPLGAYHTFDELAAELQSLAQQYPEICLVQSIGKSVLGRDLWFMKISDNVTLEEAEPEFKYISSMHGNEPVGMEMCMYLINYLLGNYGQDTRITNLVDETEIWIMPLMNPDGYIARRRWNNNDIDLNRNFPDRIADPNNSVVGRQPETQAVMNFAFNHSFVLSANFHTGALVVNYPYDSNTTGSHVNTPSPDDELFIDLSKTYSMHNLPMWNSWSFENGITNGADWYVMYGGMQDWNYVWQSCNDVTIELSDVMWPEESQLDTFWENNRESMLSYLEAVHWGVRGFVTDSLSGLPLAATVDVVGIDHAVFCDPDVGDYYRLLLPDEYSMIFSADGYVSKEISSVFVVQKKTTQLDVQLVPASARTISGTVVDKYSGLPVKANLEFSGNQCFFAEAGENGAFQLVLPSGNFRVKIMSDAYMSETDTIEVFEDQSFQFELTPAVFLFNSDFENDTGAFTSYDSLWQRGEPGFGPSQAFSGENVWGTYLDGAYPNLADASLVMPVISLPDAERIELVFRHWMQAEVDSLYPGIAYDGGIVEILPDGSAEWKQIYPMEGYPYVIPSFIDSGPFAAGTALYSGSQNWQLQEFNLVEFSGQTVQLRFRFGSDKDNAAPFAGWYLDDVVIKYPAERTEISMNSSIEKPLHFSLGQNYPNPFNSSTTLKYALDAPGFVQLSIFNSRGQLVKRIVNEQVAAGVHRIQWDGSDSFGQKAGSGIYFVQLECNSQKMTRKIIMMK